jgi:hypothetical protein
VGVVALGGCSVSGADAGYWLSLAPSVKALTVESNRVDEAPEAGGFDVDLMPKSWTGRRALHWSSSSSLAIEQGASPVELAKGQGGDELMDGGLCEAVLEMVCSFRFVGLSK